MTYKGGLKALREIKEADFEANVIMFEASRSCHHAETGVDFCLDKDIVREKTAAITRGMLPKIAQADDWATRFPMRTLEQLPNDLTANRAVHSIPALLLLGALPRFLSGRRGSYL